MAVTVLRAGDILISQTGWYDLKIAYTTQSAHTVLMRVYKYTSAQGRQLVYDRRVPCHAGTGTGNQVSGDFFYLESSTAYHNPTGNPKSGNYNYQINIEFDDAIDYGPQGAPGPSNARTINFSVSTSVVGTYLKNGVDLVVVAHSDDETIMYGGIIKQAVTAGRAVKVVVVTGKNDNNRMYETSSAMKILGLEHKDVIFLMYGDGFMKSIYNGQNYQDITNGHYSDALFDYNRLTKGRGLPYEKNNVVSNIEEIINNYKPANIYSHNEFCYHDDHVAVFKFVNDALKNAKRNNPTYSPKLRMGIVAPDYSFGNYFPGAGDYYPNPFPYNGNQSVSEKPLIWQNSPNITEDSHLSKINISGQKTTKSNAMKIYSVEVPGNNKVGSQAYLDTLGYNYFLSRSVKNEEFYWTKDFANIAYIASVTQSSQNTSDGQLGTNAVNGVKSGWGDTRLNGTINYKQEWVAANTKTGWIQLNFNGTFSVKQINLYDRRNTSDNILSGILTFSSGSPIEVKNLPTDGSKHPVSFAARNITWVRFEITNSSGDNTGLCEIEAIT